MTVVGRWLVVGAMIGCGAGAVSGCGAGATSSKTSPQSAPVPAPAKSLQLNEPGAPVDVIAALPVGYVTVVDFWSVTCEACVEFGNRLAAEIANEPMIVIRKIDVGDGFTPVAQANNISALPHFYIYDKRKRLRYDLVGSDCADAGKFAKVLVAE